jgi:thiamine biosynthesis lipoprotein
MVIISLTLVSCKANQLSRYEAQFLSLFDTVTTIIGYDESEQDFREKVQIIHDDLEQYHKLYDIYNDYEGINNIKAINDNAGIAEVKVDKKIIDLLIFSKEMYKKTDGYVNIAFGSVLRIWHDYREKNIDDSEFAEIPTIEELKKAVVYTDISKLIIDEEKQTVYIADDKMRLDVGAIAKGYAVQKVVDSARERGLKSFLLNVGGNVGSIGAKPDGKTWTVGLQNPKLDENKPYVFKVMLDTECLVSSGNYQRYFMLDGVRYHHIINKDTLMPSNYFDAVSIICEDSGLADALTTALYNMSYEDGLKLLSKFENVEAVWNFADETVKYTEGFEKYIGTEKK